MRRIVSHTDFQADAVGKTFQVILEHVPVGSVAAAAVAQQKHVPRVGISGPAMHFPPEAEMSQVNRLVSWLSPRFRWPRLRLMS